MNNCNHNNNNNNNNNNNKAKKKQQNGCLPYHTLTQLLDVTLLS